MEREWVEEKGRVMVAEYLPGRVGLLRPDLSVTAFVRDAGRRSRAKAVCRVLSANARGAEPS